MLGDKTVEDRRRPVGRSVGAAVRAIVGGLGGKGVAQVIDPGVAVRQRRGRPHHAALTCLGQMSSSASDKVG